MKKNFFSIVGVIALVCFSFYYTDLATAIIKENDPIMKEIKRVGNHYKEESVNATLSGNNIIPGINGLQIDIEQTYSSMKRYGSFNDNLIVFEEVVPTISINNIYDKYIKNGNSSKNMVSLIFIIDDYSYVTEIINVLDSKSIKVTFFVSTTIVDESPDLLNLIKKSHHQIELYSNNYSIDTIKKYKRIIKRDVDTNIKYCFTELENKSILTSCSNHGMYTIMPTINTTNFPYSDVKKSIESGSIIRLNNNLYTLRELKYIINYINQKGFDIATLSELLEE